MSLSKVMYLPETITKGSQAKSLSELIDIFEKEVNVQLGFVNDKVTIEGYSGWVTTDFIARQMFGVSKSQTTDTEGLAKILAEKVFIPLKNLVESPENQCVLYQLTALTRICWTPPQAPEFGNSIGS